VKFIGNPLLKRFHPLFVLLPFIIPDFAFFADAGFTVLFALFRFLPRPRSAAVEIYSKTVERYGKAKIPEGMTLQDWGITYDELI
jgi:hypothetical protein